MKEHIHSVLFKRPYYTIAKVNDFIKKHNLNPLRHKINDKFIKIRLVKPNYKKFKYRTHTINNNLMFVICFPF